MDRCGIGCVPWHWPSYSAIETLYVSVKIFDLDLFDLVAISMAFTNERLSVMTHHNCRISFSMSLNSQSFASPLRRVENSVVHSVETLREHDSVWLEMCGQHYFLLLLRVCTRRSSYSSFIDVISFASQNLTCMNIRG